MDISSKGVIFQAAAPSERSRLPSIRILYGSTVRGDLCVPKVLKLQRVPMLDVTLIASQILRRLTPGSFSHGAYISGTTQQ
jgi:hypothetical protein